MAYEKRNIMAVENEANNGESDNIESNNGVSGVAYVAAAKSVISNEKWRQHISGISNNGINMKA